jgi:hypothetical protein
MMVSITNESRLVSGDGKTSRKCRIPLASLVYIFRQQADRIVDGDVGGKELIRRPEDMLLESEKYNTEQFRIYMAHLVSIIPIG